MTPSRHLRGSSLIEMMTVMAVMGVILGLVGTVFSCLAGLDYVAREDMAFTDTLTAVEMQLRRDAHEASVVEIVDEVAQFRHGAQTIQWKCAAVGMLREVVEGDEVKARERWSFPTPYNAEWSVEKSGDHSWVTLKLQAAQSKDKHYIRTKRDIEFTAAIGRIAQEARP